MPESLDIVTPRRARQAEAERAPWGFQLSCRDAWAAMETDCRRARRSIDCEQYIFEPDGPGGRLLDLFEAKAAEGVRVRLLVDMVGSLALYGSRRRRSLRRAGVELAFFNPVVPWPALGAVHRDHSKILLVDGAVGYLGGVGIARRMTDWRDTHVRLEGPLLDDIAGVFAAMLDRARRRPAAWPAPVARPGGLRLVTTGERPDTIHRLLLAAIGRAERRILMTTPYFVPDAAFLGSLAAAVRRGVDVRLLVCGRPDRVFVDRVAQTFYTPLLAAGGRVFLYDGMIHAKSVVVDEGWATVGSANLDHLSFFRNYEANLVATERAFVAALARHFEDDLAVSREIELAGWRRRPLRHRAAGRLGCILTRLL